MGMMKTLAIALEDGTLNDTDLDDVRRDGWHDSMVGTYDPLQYDNVSLKRVYYLGHIQYHAAVGRTQTQPINPTTILCGCTGCTNEATHRWSGHPTCDECASPSRKRVNEA